MRALYGWLIGALALFVMGSEPPRAEACGTSTWPVFVPESHPEAPFEEYTTGNLGIVYPGFADTYLVMAYRYLAGLPLAPEEQVAARGVLNARLMGERLERPGSPPPRDVAWRRWASVYERVTGKPPTSSELGFTVDYAYQENCLADGVETAAETLEQRVQRFGAKGAPAARYAEAQDLVFQCCDRAKQVIPPPLPTNASALERADRAYQTAAAHFYAGQLPEAEARFRAIAAGTDDFGWRDAARLSHVRSLARQGAFTQARAELERLLAEPSASRIHAELRRYRVFVDAHLDREQAAVALSVRLGQGPLGEEFGAALYDLAYLGAPAQPPRSDRLGTFIRALRAGAKGHGTALELYQRTKNDVWLVAALLTAQASLGAALDPILTAAAAVPAARPAFATAAYHRLKLLVERDGPSPRLYRETRDALARLPQPVARSTRHAFAELALLCAPDLSAVLAHSATERAGIMQDGATYAVPEPPAERRHYLHPTAAQLFNRQLPSALWARAAQAPQLPSSIRPRVVASAYVRAHLLGHHKTARALAALVRREHPALASRVVAVEGATSDDLRRLALLDLLLEAPSLSYELRHDGAGPITPEPIDTMYGEYLWCEARASAAVPTVMGRANAGKQVSAEQRVLAELGAGPSFVAREAVALARRLPKDPRVPKLLHLAVRATRFGCQGEDNRRWSRAAFQTLHQQYPRSAWAKRTPYYY